MHIIKYLQLAAIILLLSILTGCGDLTKKPKIIATPTPSPTPTLTPTPTPGEPASTFNGKIVDNAVKGLTFVCADVNGTTDINGSFGVCPIDSKVRFFIGELGVGSSFVTEDKIFFVTDIADENLSRDDIDDENVIKIARVLMTLDADGDLSNGIEIPSEVGTILKAIGLKPGFTIKQFVDSRIDITNDVLIQQLKPSYPNIKIVTGTEAQAHLADTLVDIKNGTIAPAIQP